VQYECHPLFLTPNHINEVAVVSTFKTSRILLGRHPKVIHVSRIGKCSAFLGDEEAYAGGDIVICSPIGQHSLFPGYLINHSTIRFSKSENGTG